MQSPGHTVLHKPLAPVDDWLTWSSGSVEIDSLVQVISAFPSLASFETTSTSETITWLRGFPPLMKVLMPVSVAPGTAGNLSIPSFSGSSFLRRHIDAIRFFLLMFHRRLRSWSRKRDSWATKTERNEEKDTMITAVQASTCSQNRTHTKSTVRTGPIFMCTTSIWTADRRITAMIIINIGRHRVVAKTSFWRRLICTSQRIWMGMISTRV